MRMMTTTTAQIAPIMIIFYRERNKMENRGLMMRCMRCTGSKLSHRQNTRRNGVTNSLLARFVCSAVTRGRRGRKTHAQEHKYTQIHLMQTLRLEVKYTRIKSNKKSMQTLSQRVPHTLTHCGSTAVICSRVTHPQLFHS